MPKETYDYQKRSEVTKKSWQDPEIRNRRISGLKKAWESGKHRREYPIELYPNFANRGRRKEFSEQIKRAHKLGRYDSTSMKMKLLHKSGRFIESHKRVGEKRRGIKFSEKWRKNLSISHKGKSFPHPAARKNWQNPEYREKHIKAILKGLSRRPTSLEQKAIGFHKKYNLPFTYCGDGTLLIGYKNPDFYESNGKKICLEYANRVLRHHPENYEQKRIEHFAKYGWRCLVIRDNELDDEEGLVKKIVEGGSFCEGV